MLTFKNRLAPLCCRAVYSIFILLTGAIFLSTLWSSFRAGQLLHLACSLLPAVFMAAALLFLKRCALPVPGLLMRTPLLLSLLTLCCLLVKSAAAFSVSISPESDYYTFFHTAELLAENPVLPQEDYTAGYVALFPHIFGYAFFLSLFFKLFGAGTAVAVTVNVLLSTGSMLLLFRLCDRLFSRRAAVIAAVLWIFCPSQCLYNSLVLSEPLYTFLLLAALVLLCSCLEKTSAGGSFGSIAGLSAAAALLLRAVNLCRPLSAIILIALVLFLFLCRSGSGNLPRRAAVCAIVLGVYFFSGPAADAYVQQRLGREPASSSGYSIYVGFNGNSTGTWNAPDSETLTEVSQTPGYSAEDTQSAMLSLAKERIQAYSLPGLFKLFFDKLYYLWGSDSACINYLGAVLDHPVFLSLLCSGFYYCVLLLSATGATLLLKKEDSSALLLPTLFFIGLTCAHMLVEVAGRYHYSGIPCLIILAACALGGKRTSAVSSPASFEEN